ncbi:MAG: uroporphyrinogen decarboxylase family protein [Candidatus Firestonebacteria bacterium]
MIQKEIYLNAIQGKKTPRPGIGNPVSIVCTELMDKTGVFFPEAHTDASKMAALALAGHTLLGFDNVMPYFSVVHEAAGSGSKIDWGRKDVMPSTVETVWRGPEDIDVSDKFLEHPQAKVVPDAIRILKKELKGAAAVNGKVFGPWTLAYHTIGMEDFLMGSIENPERTRKILEKLKVLTIKYARAQIEAGADCITLADHVTRDLCSPEAYRDYVLPIHKELAKEIEVPVILHICGFTLDRIAYINESGFACFHYDSKNDDGEIRKAATKIRLAGGTNNTELLRKGTAEAIISDIEQKMRTNIELICPECAVPLDTPMENLKVFGRYFKTIK